MPAVKPETTPEELTEATEVVPELHVPPDTEEEKEVVEPTHTVWVPERVPAFKGAVTVTVLVAFAFGQPFVPVTV